VWQECLAQCCCQSQDGIANIFPRKGRHIKAYTFKRLQAQGHEIEILAAKSAHGRAESVEFAVEGAKVVEVEEPNCSNGLPFQHGAT